MTLCAKKNFKKPHFVKIWNLLRGRHMAKRRIFYGHGRCPKSVRGLRGVGGPREGGGGSDPRGRVGRVGRVLERVFQRQRIDILLQSSKGPRSIDLRILLPSTRNEGVIIELCCTYIVAQRRGSPRSLRSWTLPSMF